MTNAELAQKIRDAVYECATREGGAISREQMQDAIEGVLKTAACRHDALIGGAGMMLVNAAGDTEPFEWR